MRRSSGVTIVEMLVGMGLLVLVTAMMISLLLPSFALFRRQSGQSDAYRSCLLLVDRFRQELLNTQLETITIAPDFGAISWQKSQAEPPFSGTNGEPMMEDKFQVLFYESSGGHVFLVEVPGSGSGVSTIPSRLTPEALESLRSPSAGEPRTLARDITAFQVTDGDSTLPLISPPFRLTITCTIDTKGRETNDQESFSMTASVTPRSQRW